MILAGDVGGTKTLLGLFDHDAARPRPVRTAEFKTLDYPDLGAMIDELTSEPAARTVSIDAACFGVAGPVIGDTAELTNVPWRIEARAIAGRFGFPRVDLLNDLQAMAYGVTVLEASEIHVLQAGESRPGGNMGLLAAGTGLGEALLHTVGGRFVPVPSEGGHADFAARNEREITLLRQLIARFGRAQVEDVVSGPGLRNIHDATHSGACAGVRDLDSRDAPAAIAAAALGRRCDGCVEALEMFVEAYGAEAGNLALRGVATGGVFVGGGIAPKILPAISDGRFMRAFLDKAPFVSLLAAMPVKVILNPETGLLGAAVFAARQR
ncbi:MAG: glucokinase [Acidobacteriota bacterium]